MTEPTGWKPIQTAPKDGTFFLGLTWDRKIRQGYYVTEGFLRGEMRAVDSLSLQSYSHWMPLPEMP